MASTAYNYLAIYDGTPSGAAGVILNDNFSDISDLTIDSIRGLHTSNGTDASHDIDITTGAATDSTNASVLVLSSAITKQIDASWSVGTAAGGLDTGSVTTSTWYAIWLIKRSDTGVVDALFSTSFSSPTMPTNYDYKRYIGAVLTDGSSNIYGYTQTGDTWIWDYYFDDVNDSTPTTTITDLRTSTPPVVAEWIGEVYLQLNGTVTRYVNIWGGDGGSTALTGSRYVIQNLTASGTADIWQSVAPTGVYTNSSGQIRWAASHNDFIAYLAIRTYGYTDPRGRTVN